VTPSAKLFEHALALPREERAELAQALLHSIDGEDVSDASELAWQAELEARGQRISDGTAELTPWAEAKQAILGELRARREARGR
jgi:putative addiction module component (TIGR02574 family)